ncbi:efflux RND transporter periplasmic adaptor subunit [Kushneria aurantia]|uniref:Efflux RND transporter periplasmic adaptor subunit n=1 Tax=Kushneria aurantia TaxID=504092 RepID=A0ABV6G5X5_9GAMM|nr:efflux RND transporter periplasmic adaptor subunit [Kushneria aurantia]
MPDTHDARRPLAWLAALVLIALALLVLWWWFYRDSAPTEQRAPEPVAVGVAPVIERDVSASLSGLGSVLASESLNISSLVSERIADIRFESGQQVARNDILIQLDARQEREELRAARLVAEQERRELQRLEPLASRGAIATRQLDEQRNLLNNAEAEVARLEVALEDRTIRAPVDGVVGLADLSPGEMISAGTPLVTLDRLSRVHVDFPLPERQLGQVAIGMTATATSPAWPEQRFKGAIVAIDPRLNPDTRTLTLRAAFDNPQQRLRTGMLMEVAVQLPAQLRRIVPETALMSEAERHWVFMLAEDDAGMFVRRVPVAVVTRRPGWAAVTPGGETPLPPDARVVVSGLPRLDAERRVVLDDSAHLDTALLFQRSLAQDSGEPQSASTGSGAESP